MHKTCPQCGKTFTPSDLPHANNFKRQKLCSRACMHAAKKYDAERSVQVMWSRVNKNGPNGCWIYSGQVNSKGYGAFTYNGKPMVAVHRFIYQQIHGPLPRSVYCLHKCDNPLCVNPDHIFLGNDADNMRDKVAKGRHPKGEQAWNAKLTEQAVREIRRDFRKAGPSKSSRSNARELARKYGVKVGQINGILAGRYWSHVK